MKKENEILKRLWEYQDQRELSNIQLARKIDTYIAYIYRWKKNGRISRANQRLVELFLKGIG